MTQSLIFQLNERFKEAALTLSEQVGQEKSLTAALGIKKPDLSCRHSTYDTVANFTKIFQKLCGRF